MALLILTKKKVLPKDILDSIEKCCETSGVSLSIEKTSNPKYFELYISKKYKTLNQENEDYFYLNLENDQIEIKDENKSYYRLGVTDQADYDHLMYDFSLEYLKLNPNHIISLYGESFFTITDLEKIELEGGYYTNWCFGVSRTN